MKKFIILAIMAITTVQLSIAQNTESRRSDRKIIELKKIVSLSTEQEENIRTAYEKYSDRNDSILYKVQNPVKAAELKRRSEMIFNKRLMNVLNEEQRKQYFQVMAAPEITEKTKAKVDELEESGLYTTAQLDSAKKAIYKQLMQEKIVYGTQKYDYKKQKKDIAQLKKNQRSDRKIREIKKVIKLSPTQETALREAYSKHQQMGDSILLRVKDAATAAQLKYESDKEFHTVLMKTLTESQRNTYITVNATPEVMAKAKARTELLRETGNYTEEQLAQATTNIFNYLILEKIVYERDKYDYLKQKENIRQLKKLEPSDLKKANTQEKLKTEGKYYQGKTKW